MSAGQKAAPCRQVMPGEFDIPYRANTRLARWEIVHRLRRRRRNPLDRLVPRRAAGLDPVPIAEHAGIRCRNPVRCAGDLGARRKVVRGGRPG